MQTRRFNLCLRYRLCCQSRRLGGFAYDRSLLDIELGMRQQRPSISLARRGFTLIEAAIVTIIVGVGVVGMLQLLAAGSMANTQSTELTTAMGLVSNIHERALGIKYDELLANFNNKTWTGTSGPIDAKANVIANMGNWAQIVDFQYVDPNNIKSAVPDTQPEATGRMTVTISHNNRNLYTTSWLVAASEWP